MKKAPQTDLQQVFATNRAQWRAWLERNHASSPPVVLVFYKKATGRPCITYDEAVEEALCFGWIDSRKNSLDATRYTFMFSPRRPGSGWSSSNKARVGRLTAAGLMALTGLAKVDEAKRDGSWTALDHLESPREPPAFAKALARDRKARHQFDALNPSPRRLLLRWVASAKRPETQQARIDEVVAAARRGALPELLRQLMTGKRTTRSRGAARDE